ncbi:MAG: hypothetical protein HQ506_09275 [Candidatus Marinimicrobia bacterium]|nr:hypothetical protein [Candidatus Neomarinimicrobiota bacterium]
MIRLGPKIVLLITLLPLFGNFQLIAQGVTLFYDGNKSIRNCRIIEVSELEVSVEYTPFLPGVYVSRNLTLDSIIGIREFSRSNKYAPYLMLLGSYLAVKYFMQDPVPRSEKTLSERFATWLDEPLNFLSSVCIGGSTGYIAGYILLGGNRELIVLKKLSSSEKQMALTPHIKPSMRGGHPKESDKP